MKRSETVLLGLFCTFMLLLGALVYYPGLRGPFLFDDWPNLLHNKHVQIEQLDFSSIAQAAFSSTSGTLKRPVSMLSFALNYFASGFDPFFFKLTNLFIHLANGAGIYILTLLLLGEMRKNASLALAQRHVHWLSALIAAAWLLHPLNLTSVLYVVQRMSSLASFFMLAGLISYVWGRSRQLENKGGGWKAILASFVLFTPLAVFSKENGALLPLFICTIEVVFFKFKAPNAGARTSLLALFALFLALPAGVGLLYLAWHPGWILHGYAARDFTLGERLLTEARVLWFYIKLILLPASREMAIYHDDIALSHGILDPWTTLPSIAGLAALTGGAFFFRKNLPILFFGVLFFFVGHSIESTVLSLEIAHEHRNYLPMYGILLPFFFYLLYPLASPDTFRFRSAVAIVLVGLFAFNTASRAQHWGDFFELSQYEAENHPDSPRANLQLGVLYKNSIIPGPDGEENNYPIAREYLEKSSRLQKSFTIGLFELIHLNSSRGKPAEKNWLLELEHKLEHEPISANTGNALVKLEACQVKGDCLLSDDDMQKLLQAALRNHTLSGLNKGAVLFAMADHVHMTLHDDGLAVRLAFEAAEAAPGELEYRRTLIEFLIALHRFNLAHQQLDFARKLDKMQTYHSSLSALEKTLLEEEGKHKAQIPAFHDHATKPNNALSN